MGAIGSRIEETGTLLRDGGGSMLRRDSGGRYQLDLHRVPVDEVEKRVRVVGVLVGENLIDVEASRRRSSLTPAAGDHVRRVRQFWL